MNRREIIIVAALINAGLLITLFVTGIKKEEKPSLVYSPPKEVEIASLPRKLELPPPLVQESEEVGRVIGEIAKPLIEQEGEKMAVEIPPVQKETLPSIPAAPPKKEGGQEKVVVGKGDVLEKIARQHQVSVKEIMSLNRLSNTRLQIGQVLLMPSPTPKKEKEEKKKEEEGEYYTVKAGDNPWTIAHKNHLPIEELLRLNGMNEEKAKKLKPGDRLRIK
jgi:peptidoglycan DL-endopeptidase LytF